MSAETLIRPELYIPDENVIAIVGLQRGDEGKGRFVDMLAAYYDIVARFNGGDNAGHTVVLPDGRVLKLHMIPSGVAYDNAVNVVGRGCVVNPLNLVREIGNVEAQGLAINEDNFKLDGGTQLILPHHIFDDVIREAGAKSQGSTKSGIAQVSSDKVLRTGMRTDLLNNDVDELFNAIVEGLQSQEEARQVAGLDSINAEEVAEHYIETAQQLGTFVTDSTYYLRQRLKKGARILAEGAQAFLLDPDHGMAPYTTSTPTTAGAVAAGLGISPFALKKVIGVMKATQSHVGGGPFVTEITEEENPELLSSLHGDQTTVDAEFGTTTGRKRRLGHLDLPQIVHANEVNDTTEAALTKLDWVPRYGKTVLICTSYERKGKVYTEAPDSARKLEECIPQYEELPTWKEDITHVRRFSDLPKNAKSYINFIEEKTEVPIKMIGVGPARDQVIVRN